MLIDGRHPPHHGTLRSDVVVVGAGPAGITIAEELAASGFHVLLVEAAGRVHGRIDDDFLSGDSSGEPFPLVRSRHRGFGGTSTHWTQETGLRVRPLDAIDFESSPCRPDSSWPFALAALEPFYDRAHRSIGLESGYETARWFGPSSPTPLAWRGGPELAMFQFTDFDVFTRRFGDIARSPAIDLVLQTSVKSIELTDDGSSVRRMVAVSSGNEFYVAAPTFVLACGGIDNARVMLSSPGATGRGVGNEHDNVGRYFMDHLSVDTGVIVPDGSVPVSGAPFRGLRSDVGRSQPMLWLGGERVSQHGLPNAAFWIDEVDAAYVSDGVGAARSLRAAWRSQPRRAIAKHVAHSIGGAASIIAYSTRLPAGRSRRARILAMRVMVEQVPNRESRVRLSERRDRNGTPRVDLDWRISSADLDGIVEHQRLLGDLLAARGIATLTAPFEQSSHRSPVMSNFHHIGTTRMHSTARRGVVDVDSRVHTVPNLYVIGSSVFPSGGYVNPTLTIIALAMKAADAVRRDRGPVRVQSMLRDQSVSCGSHPLDPGASAGDA